MSRRAGSPTSLVLGFVVIAVAIVVGQWRLDVVRRDGRQAAASINNNLRMAEQSLAEFRAAQTGYIAAGQNADEWMNHAMTIKRQLDGAIVALTGSSRSSEALVHYQSATAIAAELTANDKKAREFVSSGQSLVASDVLFQEGAEPVKRLASELAEARNIEMAAFEKSATRLGWIGVGASGLGFAVGVFVLFIGTRTRQAAADQSPAGGLNLQADAAQSTPQIPQPIPAARVADDPFAASTIDLTSAAELCVDLGRIIDGEALPALVTRAARVLEAKGLVLWVREGGALRPTVAHGYSDRVLQRMGTLPIDGDNVTSLAFRSMQSQVVRGSSGDHGALAVPLITSSGCVGVLAVEVPGATPGDTRFAVARMIAAQLSTIVGPGVPMASATKAAEA
jgi:hypothetical protein